MDMLLGCSRRQNPAAHSLHHAGSSAGGSLWTMHVRELSLLTHREEAGKAGRASRSTPWLPLATTNSMPASCTCLRASSIRPADGQGGGEGGHEGERAGESSG